MIKYLVFYKAAEQLPEISGDYMCVTRGIWQELHYSAKYKSFNQYDDLDFKPDKLLDVEYWAKIPKMD